MKEPILAVGEIPSFLSNSLQEQYEYHVIKDESEWADVPQALHQRIRAVVATGESKVPASLQNRLPKLEIIAVFGVGYDGVDAKAAQSKGVKVTNTPDVLTDDVADLAFGLALAVARNIVGMDKFVRAGRWRTQKPALTQRVSGKKLGIIGLGRIGKAIATRGEAFGMSIAYTGPHKKTDVSYSFYETSLQLAAESDFLIVAAHGGAATRNLVNKDILHALGPNGILINIGRGSVVDEQTLISALQNGEIAGAGLDVFAHEPEVPEQLMNMANVVLTPHAASGTVETRHAMGDLVIENLIAHFSGEPLITPIFLST